MTAPTLPAMSEDELIELWQSSDPHGPSANERFARAIIAARDAQWAARLDQERHDAYVTGQRDGAQYVQERMKRGTEVLRIERDDARRMRDAAMKHISDGVALQIPAVTLQGFTEQQVQARIDAAVMAEREMCAHYCERVAVAFEAQGKPRDGDLYGRAIREAARTIRARTKD